MRLIDIAEIPGDPGAMRATAGAIEAEIAALQEVEVELLAKVDDLAVMAPLGDRLRGQVRTMCRDIVARCVELALLAGRIRARADQVEAEQAARLRLIERLEADERERMRDAAGGRGG